MDPQILTWLLNQTPVIVVLGGALAVVWNRYTKELDYSREQEKIMISTLNGMSNVLEKVNDSDEELKEAIRDMKLNINELLIHVKNK